MVSDLQEEWMKKSRFLIPALIFSGALNIGLLSSLIYVIIQEKSKPIVFELEPIDKKILKTQTAQLTLQQTLSQFSSLPYLNLVALLHDQDHVEEGYKKRDLALATLVSFHFIHLEKALQGWVPQKRTLFFQRTDGPEQIGVHLYPGLTEDQFKEIIHFIETEKYPFTAQGLFLELQQQSKKDPSLIEAFYLTPECTTMVTLFFRSGLPIPPEAVIEVLLQGDWPKLEQFTKEQKNAQDLSPDRLKLFLIQQLKCRSLFSAQILLSWDPTYVLKNLEDSDLMALIDLSPKTTPALNRFLKMIIRSPRSDCLWEKAADRLFQEAGLPIPDPYDHTITLKTFALDPVHSLQNPDLPKSSLQQTPKSSPPTITHKKHIVEKGDCLWKIARKYQISLDALTQANQLKTDALRIGQELKIPLSSQPSSNPL